MYPIIAFKHDDQRRDNFRSWLDQQFRLTDDPLVERAVYYTKNERHGIFSGAATLRPGERQIEAFDSDLFLIVTAGQITLRLADGTKIVADEHESLVIPRGARLRWSSATQTQVWFVAYQPEQAIINATAQPFKVDADAALDAIDGPSAELITSAPYPEVHRKVVYLSADGKFSVGLWQATAYTRRLAAFGDYELMYPIEGEIHITNALGESHTFGAHQGFIVNRGVSNAWRSTTLVKKIYSKISV